MHNESCVTWPSVVIAVCPSCACSLLVNKTMLVEQKKLQKSTYLALETQTRLRPLLLLLLPRFNVLRW